MNNTTNRVSASTKSFRQNDRKSVLDSVSTANAFESISLYDHMPVANGVDEEIKKVKELLPTLKYYQQQLGFDKETYELYTYLVARSREITDSFLELESNRPDGYVPLFA